MFWQPQKLPRSTMRAAEILLPMVTESECTDYNSIQFTINARTLEYSMVFKVLRRELFVH